MPSCPSVWSVNWNQGIKKHGIVVCFKTSPASVYQGKVLTYLKVTVTYLRFNIVPWN